MQLIFTIFWSLLLSVLLSKHVECAYPSAINITGIVRDHSFLHRDFESNTGSNYAQVGLLWPQLESSTGWPKFVSYSQRNTSAGTRLGNYQSNEATQPRNQLLALNEQGRFFFDEYYFNVPGVNIAYTVVLQMALQNATTGTYYFSKNGGFFPLNSNLGFSTELVGSTPRNFGFTTEYRVQFYYRGGELFSFTGDDDLWVFIDGRLTSCDLGGIHPHRDCSFYLDNLGLTLNRTYTMVVIHAERHTDESNFALTTSVLPENHAPKAYDLHITINEKSTATFSLEGQVTDEDQTDFVFLVQMINNATVGPTGLPQSSLDTIGNSLVPLESGLIGANLSDANATLATFSTWFSYDTEFVFTGGENWNGTVTIPFIANDTKAASNLAAIVITVLPVNDPPVAYNGSVNVTQDETVTLYLNYSNVDPLPSDIVCFRLANPVPQNGQVQWVDQFRGILNYTGIVSGVDSIAYVVNDRGLGCDCSNITIVQPPADLVELGPGDSNTAFVSVTVEAKPIETVGYATLLPTIPSSYISPNTGSSASSSSSPLSNAAIGGIVAGAVVGFIVAAVVVGGLVYWKFSAARMEAMWNEQFRQAHGQMNPLYSSHVVESVNPIYNSQAAL